jgi:hypothetical protein
MSSVRKVPYRIPPKRPELNFDWPEVCCILMWKFKPMGCTLTRRDLGRLPRDRVLIEKRTSERITYRFGTFAQAQQAARDEIADSGNKAGLEEAQGRWQKLACVLLWKCAKDGVTVITEWDRGAIPSHLTLLQRGFKEDIELLWVSRAEAARIQQFEEEHEGRPRVVEAVRR